MCYAYIYILSLLSLACSFIHSCIRLLCSVYASHVHLTHSVRVRSFHRQFSPLRSKRNTISTAHTQFDVAVHIYFYISVCFCIRKRIHRTQKLIILEQWIWISFVRLRLCVCVRLCSMLLATVATVRSLQYRLLLPFLPHDWRYDATIRAPYTTRAKAHSHRRAMWPVIHILRITIIIISVTQLFAVAVVVVGPLLLLLSGVCSIPIAYLPFEFGLINTI